MVRAGENWHAHARLKYLILELLDHATKAIYLIDVGPTAREAINYVEIPVWQDNLSRATRLWVSNLDVRRYLDHKQINLVSFQIKLNAGLCRRLPDLFARVCIYVGAFGNRNDPTRVSVVFCNMVRSKHICTEIPLVELVSHSYTPILECLLTPFHSCLILLVLSDRWLKITFHSFRIFAAPWRLFRVCLCFYQLCNKW